MFVALRPLTCARSHDSIVDLAVAAAAVDVHAVGGRVCVYCIPGTARVRLSTLLHVVATAAVVGAVVGAGRRMCTT